MNIYCIRLVIKIQDKHITNYLTPTLKYRFNVDRERADKKGFLTGCIVQI